MAIPGRHYVTVKGSFKDVVPIMMKKMNMTREDVSSAMQSLAADCAEYTRQYIEKNVKRRPNTGRLSRSIDFTSSAGYKHMHYGVGDMSKMPPYWRIINYGGVVPAPTRGYFLDSSGGRVKPSPTSPGNQRFVESKATKSSWKLEPKAKIEGMYFIQAAQNWMKGRFHPMVRAAARRRK